MEETTQSKSTQTKKKTKKKVVKKAKYSQEELNKISPGYIYQIFDNTRCPAAVSFDIKMLEKHCYELAMKLYYFYATDSMEFRELVLDTKELFDRAVKKRIDLHKDSLH